MNRVDRLVGMILLLQSRKYCSSELIADKFEISIRTVYRDIKALGEIGVPVDFDPGKGYSISPGYFLPPLTFTHAEAYALVTSIALAKGFTEQSVIDHCLSALEKIKAGLQHPIKEKIEHLASAIYVEPSLAPTNHFSLIQQAICNKTVLSIDYPEAGGKLSRHEIEPAGLALYAFHWHVFAWCRQKKTYLGFKLVLIRGMKDTGQPHSIKAHAKIEEFIRKWR